jgi:hypothetical protein
VALAAQARAAEAVLAGVAEVQRNSTGLLRWLPAFFVVFGSKLTVNPMTKRKPRWPPGIRAIWTGPRCTAMSKQAGRRCLQAPVPGRSVCHWHGGRAGAPKGNTNNLQHGRRTAEAEIERKMGKGIRMGANGMGKIFRKIITGQLSPLVGEELLKELGDTVAVAETWRGLAGRSRTARLRRKKELSK